MFLAELSAVGFVPANFHQRELEPRLCVPCDTLRLVSRYTEVLHNICLRSLCKGALGKHGLLSPLLHQGIDGRGHPVGGGGKRAYDPSLSFLHQLPIVNGNPQGCSQGWDFEMPVAPCSLSVREPCNCLPPLPETASKVLVFRRSLHHAPLV